MLIEFRGRAAWPATPGLRFEVAVPVGDPDPLLRIAIRCRGQFAVSHSELTDGREVRRMEPFRELRVLGARGPSSGWSRIDWTIDSGTIDLSLEWYFLPVCHARA